MSIVWTKGRDLCLIIVMLLVGIFAVTALSEESKVVDHPLRITESVLAELQMLRAKPKFTALPGIDTSAERDRLEAALNNLLDRLIEGVPTHARKSWVLQQFRPALERVMREDSEARERFGLYLEEIMDTLQIQSSDGLLGEYL